MDRYEILSTIGEGTYGVVLKGLDKTSGELVAIKAFKQVIYVMRLRSRVTSAPMSMKQ
jgi:serine/threonine protein kinase